MLAVDHEGRVGQSGQFLPQSQVVETLAPGAGQVPDMVPPFPPTVRVLDEFAISLPVQDRFRPSGVPGGEPGYGFTGVAEALGTGPRFLAMRGRAGQRVDQCEPAQKAGRGVVIKASAVRPPSPSPTTRLACGANARMASAIAPASLRGS